MKALILYLEELFATPANTVGMGNPSIPSEPNTIGGSGDIPYPLCKYDKKKRKKKIKNKEVS